MMPQALRWTLVAGFMAWMLIPNTLAQPLSPDDLAALNATVAKAISAHDVSGIESWLASDAVFDFVPAPPPLTGTNAIGGFVAGLFQGFPDYTTASEQRWVSSNFVVTLANRLRDGR
jgi:SnoaL-like domain